MGYTAIAQALSPTLLSSGWFVEGCNQMFVLICRTNTNLADLTGSWKQNPRKFVVLQFDSLEVPPHIGAVPPRLLLAASRVITTKIKNTLLTSIVGDMTIIYPSLPLWYYLQ